MQIQYVRPSPSLRFFIKGYIYHNLETDAPVHFMPNEYPFLTINFGAGYDIYSEKHHGDNLDSHCLVGHTKTSYSVSSKGHMKGIGVYFEPTALCQWLRLPLNNITGTNITVNEMGDREFCVLLEKVMNADDVPQRISLLDNFFLKKAIQADIRPVDIDRATAYIRKRSGNITVSHIAGRLNISIRTLERKFLEYVGLPPKQYAKIIRINRVMRMLNRKNPGRLTDLACQSGYYDQMHFIKEFKRFAGTKPTEFVRRSVALSFKLINLWQSSAP